jgi:hypothetical protein
MNSDPSGELEKPPAFCSTCRKKIEKGKEYHHNINVLCEDCCVDMRTPRVRKTHWQYLGSIKAGYLTPCKKA